MGTVPLPQRDNPLFFRAGEILPREDQDVGERRVVPHQFGDVWGQQPVDARRRTRPIIRQTLANYIKLGPASSFSGPIVRGDVETVRKHLRALAGAPAANAYMGLAQAALEYLPSRNTEEIREILGEFIPEKTRRNAKRKDLASKRSVRRSRKSL